MYAIQYVLTMPPNLTAFQLSRVVFRFMFTVPLFILAIDGITGTHVINRNLWVRLRLHDYTGFD